MASKEIVKLLINQKKRENKIIALRIKKKLLYLQKLELMKKDN